MPYAKASDVPATLRGAGLTLAQANEWARTFDGAKSGGTAEGTAAAVAWTKFKRRHRKKGGKWLQRGSWKAEATLAGARALVAERVGCQRDQDGSPAQGESMNAAMEYLAERSSAQLRAIFAKLAGGKGRLSDVRKKIGAVAHTGAKEARFTPINIRDAMKKRGWSRKAARDEEAHFLRSTRSPDSEAGLAGRLAHSKAFTRRKKKLAAKAAS